MAKAITVAELFAGVGGFRLGLEGFKDPSNKANNLLKAGNFKTIWANQWEPPGSPTRQFAANCYRTHFGNDSVVNEDINKVLNEYEQGLRDIPSVDMVVGGFPCQDYSVAKPLSQSGGIEGKKGVLWWDIYKFLKIQLDKSPENAEWCLLENVDRLLKSPASQRGRDFAIILSCLSSLGYCVEWRVVNSAAYGFSQRRKRVYILARRNANWELSEHLTSGIMSRVFPFNPVGNISYVDIPKDPFVATKDFNSERSKSSPFLDAGVMVDNRVITCKVEEVYKGQFKTLGDVLSPEIEVPENYFVDSSQLYRWEYLKGSKREERTNKHTGQTYFYSEGSMAFPDLLTNPSRTILTGEGGASPSRFKHIIKVGERYRRLVPDELDQLQGFPKGWTNTGMSDNNRAFCMGNALVVGVVNRIGKEIYKEL